MSTEHFSHMDRVNARQADPQTNIDAQARSDRVNTQLKNMHVNKMALMMQDEKSSKHRFMWLREITGTLGKAAQGIAPCKAGCSHCCNIPALISVQEAEALSKVSRRPMVMPPPSAFADPLPGAHPPYYGVPCPFLKGVAGSGEGNGESTCSVYAERPYVCRVHLSMDVDNLLCHTKNGQNSVVPFYNNTNLHLLHFLAHDDPAQIKMADIRDFFPVKDIQTS